MFNQSVYLAAFCHYNLMYVITHCFTKEYIPRKLNVRIITYFEMLHSASLPRNQDFNNLGLNVP